MNTKKKISEQTENVEKQKSMEILKKAIELGCFQELDIILGNEPPKEVDGSIVLEVTGKTSQKIYYFYSNGWAQLKGEPNARFQWKCPNLDDYIKKQDVQAPQPTKQVDVTKTDVSSENDINDIIKKTEEDLEKQRPEGCVKLINSLYSFYDKTKNGYKTDKVQMKKLRDAAQKCLREPEIKNKLFFSKLPLIGDKFRKKLDVLMKINDMDPTIGMFRLYEQKELSQIIKETLKKTKKLKEEKEKNKKIVEARLKTILKDYSEFEKLTENKKVKVGFKLLRETKTLEDIGLLNESFTEIMKFLYGNSYGEMSKTISGPMIENILKSLNLDGEILNNIKNNIGGKISELTASMDTCETLSDFISECVLEEFLKKIESDKMSQKDVLSTTLLDSLDEEVFKNNLKSKLKEKICEMYDKFTENAKNLVVRMNAL